MRNRTEQEALFSTDQLRELIVFALGVIQRRWRLLLAPIATTLVLALIAVKLSPMTYTTKALLLIQSANRPAAGAQLQSTNNFTRQVVMDQVAALETWLKSDEVLGGLLPRLVDPATLSTPEGIEAQLKIVRASLTMEVVGGSAVEIRLDGRDPRGLAGKLEAIVERLMEGLTRPEKGILNSTQFIELQRREAVANAEAALSRAILMAGIVDNEKTRNVLKQINDYKLQLIANGSGPGSLRAETSAIGNSIRTLRAQLTDDQKVADRLELLYAEYHVARSGSADLRGSLSSNRSNYIGIFESPENLLIVGRPQDPVYGQRPAKKLAVVSILFSVLLAVALVIAAELLNRRLFMSAQFRAVSGLPVIMRVPA